MQVGQDRHILRAGVCQIGPVDYLHSTVNDCLFDGFQPVLAAHDKLTERQHEIAFQGQRVFVLTVIQVDVQRVHIGFAGGRQLHHLAVEPFHKGVIFRLWIADIYIVRRTKEHTDDLGFTAHGFAGTGSTQLQSVGTPRPFSVQHNHVSGLGIDTVIHGVAAHEKLLCHERHEHGHAGSRQGTLDLDVVGPQRQAAHKALFLLVVQTDKGTVVFLRHACGPKYIVLQLLPGVGGVHHQKGDLEHSFIPALQGFQKLLGVLSVGGKVAGQDVHVVAAADSSFLFLYLHGVKVGDLALNRLDGLALVDGLHMEIDDNAVFRVEEVGQHFVRQLRGQDV